MKLLCLLSLLSSAAAFAPLNAPTTPATALSAASMSEMRGSIDFKRQPFAFDPLKLADTYGPLLPYIRDAEIRNGRTAMLGVVGLIVPEFVRIPGETYSFENCPRVMDAVDKCWVGGFGSPMFQLIFWIGMWEFIVAAPAIAASMKGDRAPGDYAQAAWLLKAKKPPTQEKIEYLEDSELLNGRLAMIGFMGMFAQSFVTDNGFPYI